MEKNLKDWRIIFMGTSGFSVTVLDALVKAGYNLSSIYTRPDKQAGRNQELKASAIKTFGQSKKIPVFCPQNLDDHTIQEIRNQKPDILIVVAYGKILPKVLLDIPPYGSLNIHASMLPKYRGPSPIQNTLLKGDRETGVTLIKMNENIDAGDILGQERIIIEINETLPQLSERLARLSADLLLKLLPKWLNNKIKPQKQDDAQATFCQMIERSDGRVIWSDEAESIYNRYRAFYAWPGIFTFWEQEGSLKRIKLIRIRLIRSNPETEHHIGEVFQIGEDVGVQTTLGIIIIDEIQVEGKPSMPIKNFLNGYPNFIGSLLK